MDLGEPRLHIVVGHRHVRLVHPHRLHLFLAAHRLHFALGFHAAGLPGAAHAVHTGTALHALVHVTAALHAMAGRIGLASFSGWVGRLGFGLRGARGRLLGRNHRGFIGMDRTCRKDSEAKRSEKGCNFPHGILQSSEVLIRPDRLSGEARPRLKMRIPSRRAYTCSPQVRRLCSLVTGGCVPPWSADVLSDNRHGNVRLSRRRIVRIYCIRRFLL